MYAWSSLLAVGGNERAHASVFLGSSLEFRGKSFLRRWLILQIRKCSLIEPHNYHTDKNAYAQASHNDDPSLFYSFRGEGFFFPRETSRDYREICCCCCCFLTFSVLVANPKKTTTLYYKCTLYNVALALAVIFFFCSHSKTRYRATFFVVVA